MADERVLIKIEVKSDDGDIDKTRRKLERLAGARDRDRKSEGLASRSRSSKLKREFTSSGNEFDKVSRKYKKSFDMYDKMIKMTGGGMMKLLALTTKAVALEMAAMGAAMMLVHASFAAGNLIMKAYNGVMKMAAAGMAGLVIAAGTVAAALREQQAAMYAFSGRGQAKEFGSALNQTRVQMRALTTDASLASVGVENLTAAYAEVVKTGGRFSAASQKSLKGLMDFASAGMDMKEGTKQAGALIATLQDTKKSYGDVVGAGKKFSPQLKKALEEYEKGSGEKTKAGLTAAIRSGELAKLGGVDGQFGAVSGTLINTLKGEFNLLRGQFADFGQVFLGPMKKEAKEVFAIIRLAIQRISGQVATFGQGGFIDKISVVVDKIANFFVRTIRDFLPGSMGIFERIGDWWDKFTTGFERIKDILRPFIAGAKIIEKMLMNVLAPVFEQIKANFYTFNDQLRANAPAMEEFGTNVGNLLTKVMEYFAEARKLFFQALPFINKVVKGFTSLIELFTSFLGGFTKLTGGMGNMGGVGALMGLIGLSRGMKNTKGYFTRDRSSSGIREVANMNVRSGTVYINGKPVANYGPKGSGGSTGLVPRSNNIQTGPLPHRGPFMGPPGSTRGASSSTGFASTGAKRGSFVKTAFDGRGQAGMGPNGGTLITSGPNKGKEILTQRVRGKDVPYLYGGRGTGKENYSNKNLNNISTRSGVSVNSDSWMKGNRKIVDATGRIITRRENFARAIGEGQGHGVGGFRSDGRPKTMLDRMMGRNTGATGFVGRAADRYRNKLVSKSNYLGPAGPPVNPRTGRPFGPNSKAFKTWQLTSTRAYGPGTYDPNSMKGRFLNGRLYNNWLGSKSDISSQGPRELSKRNPFRAVQSARLGARGARQSRLGGAILGNDNRKGFQGSGMAGMGVGMGLGMLGSSGLVSEEASGFLSAGAMVGMMNPLAGLAIGLGGTALTAKTAGGGAVAGAGAGAAIGSMIAPGFGTAAGAIIGAAVGGLMGRANKIKDEKKQAREVMEGVFDNLVTNQLTAIQGKMVESGFMGKSAIISESKSLEATSDAIFDMAKKGTGTDFANNLYARRGDLGIDMTSEQRDKMLKQPAETTKYLEKEIEKRDAANHITGVYQKRLDELTKMTGKSEQAVEKMAMEMGVNLMDVTVDFNQVLKDLGVSVEKTSAQMRGLQMDLALAGLSDFDQRLAEINAPAILDEQARAFRDLYDTMGSEAMAEADMLEFAKNFIPNFLNYVGGGLQGVFELERQFGINGSAFGQTGEVGRETVDGPFAGMEKLFTTGAFGQMLQGYIGSQQEKGSLALGGDLNSFLLNQGGTGSRFQIDSKGFSTALQGMDSESAGRLTTAIQDGTLFADTDLTKLGSSDILKALSSFGMDTSLLGLRTAADNDELMIALDAMPDETRKTYEGIIKQFEVFFSGERTKKPEWMTASFIKLAYENADQDTSTPRGKGIGDTTSSRLAQTLSRHSSMNGMITGKRTMTSAYRTNNLGSINSDHVTGRAYDLVGQNLGSYSRLVHANGGFAEFHGSNASRHLHVVPGAGPFGDSTSIAAPNYIPPMSSSGGKDGGSIQVVQNIQAGPNASPTEIAQIAVREMRIVLDNERQRR